jgi:hypothetical protein
MASQSITSAIADRDRLIADLERQVEQARAERATLVKAAALMGLVPEVVDGGEESAHPKRGGKQPGAISQKWREVLGTLAASPAANSYEDIRAAANLHDMDVEMGSVRERVRKFIDFGYLMKNPDGKFSVTVDAVRKFGLSKTDAAPTQEVNAA